LKLLDAVIVSASNILFNDMKFLIYIVLSIIVVIIMYILLNKKEKVLLDSGDNPNYDRDMYIKFMS